MSQNTVPIWMVASLQYLLITVKVVAMGKVTFSETQNSKAVCWHMDSWWQALSGY